MTQNIASLTLTDAQLTAVDAALTELETQLTNLIGLSGLQKRGLKKMGEKSEAFCRAAMVVMQQNPQLVPPNVSSAGAMEDLVTIDRLRPRMARLARLSERAIDTELALGSDVMATSLQVYGLLKLSGANEGLKSAQKELRTLFARAGRPLKSEPIEVKAA